MLSIATWYNLTSLFLDKFRQDTYSYEIGVGLLWAISPNEITSLLYAIKSYKEIPEMSEITPL